MANFEVFRGNFSLSTKSEFGRTRRSGGRLLCAPSCVTFYHHDHPFLACATEKKIKCGWQKSVTFEDEKWSAARQCNAASSIHIQLLNVKKPISSGHKLTRFFGIVKRHLPSEYLVINTTSFWPKSIEYIYIFCSYFRVNVNL